MMKGVSKGRGKGAYLNEKMDIFRSIRVGDRHIFSSLKQRLRDRFAERLVLQSAQSNNTDGISFLSGHFYGVGLCQEQMGHDLTHLSDKRPAVDLLYVPFEDQHVPQTSSEGRPPTSKVFEPDGSIEKEFVDTRGEANVEWGRVVGLDPTVGSVPEEQTLDWTISRDSA
jgi:hypothetical protein